MISDTVLARIVNSSGIGDPYLVARESTETPGLT